MCKLNNEGFRRKIYYIEDKRLVEDKVERNHFVIKSDAMSFFYILKIMKNWKSLQWTISNFRWNIKSEIFSEKCIL